MDIQLYATDELKEFPEDKTDSDKISGPNNIHLSASDLPRPLTEISCVCTIMTRTPKILDIYLLTSYETSCT